MPGYNRTTVPPTTLTFLYPLSWYPYPHHGHTTATLLESPTPTTAANLLNSHHSRPNPPTRPAHWPLLECFGYVKIHPGTVHLCQPTPTNANAHQDADGQHQAHH